MNQHTGKIFVPYVMGLAVAKGSPANAEAFIIGQARSHAAEIVQSYRMRSVVGAMGTDGGLPSPAMADFVDALRPLTITGKLPLRVVPARTRVIAATAGSGAYWAGEKNPVPLTRMTLQGLTVELLGVTCMVVMSNEVFLSSDPAAGPVVARDMLAATVDAIDRAFLDNTNAGIAGVKPAAITNGATTFHSSGSSLAQIDADLDLLINALSDAGSDLRFAQFIVRPRTALYLSRLRGSGGALAHPGMTVKGGTLFGLPAHVSNAARSDVGSPQEGGSIILLDASQIEYADDNNGSIDVSNETSVTMADNPGSPATMTSMYQNEATALKVTRNVNWTPVRSGMVQYIDRVEY